MDYIRQQIDTIDKKISQNQVLLSDPELAELARAEIEALEKQKAELEHPRGEKMRLHPGGEITSDSCILEIRSAAGGEEAGIFAGDLLRMYTKFAQNEKWKVEELDRNVLKITGKDCYSTLKNESGVHRVQRVPVTESSGRIHTSTATVAVLPETSQTQISIIP